MGNSRATLALREATNEQTNESFLLRVKTLFVDLVII